jgi:hypothetical protein
VSKISLEDKTIVTNFVEIKFVAKSYYQELYTQKEDVNPSNIHDMLENIPIKISNEDNFDLNKPIYEAKILLAF